jgi:hypothetical protein
MKKIYVTIDGGVVVSVVSDDPDVEVRICDEDDYRKADEQERREINGIRREIETGLDKGILHENL